MCKSLQSQKSEISQGSNSIKMLKEKNRIVGAMPPH
jgi:hypothetical protein